MRNRLLILIACAVVAAPAPAAAQGLESLRERLQAKLDSLVEHSLVPGATVGVALPDGTSFGVAAGMSDTARAVAMTPESRMLQGSVGKTYFGAVALQLVAEGRLDLDAHLADFLGDESWFDRLPNARDITIRQMMQHTSGIVRYEMDPVFLEDLTADPMREFTPEERLTYLFDSEAPFAAGEGWDYADTNYILLAMVMERVTGTSSYDEVRRRVLEPLDFENTVPSNSPDVPGLVQGYAGQGNPFGGADAMMEDGRMVINPQFEWAGGGYASTTEDLARWIKDIHEGRAFDGSLLEQARDGVAAPLGPQGRYGLGVIMMELPAGTAWGHSGFMPGYRTEGYYFPDGEFGLAFQINSTAPRAFQGPLLLIFSDLAAIVMEELGG